MYIKMSGSAYIFTYQYIIYYPVLLFLRQGLSYVYSFMLFLFLNLFSVTAV